MISHGKELIIRFIGYESICDIEIKADGAC